MQSTAEHNVILSFERSNKFTQLFKILDSSGTTVHTFNKRTIVEAEAYYVNYCVAAKLQLATHMLMSVGA